jgi:ferritin-like metal-binding protein YciE
MQMDDLRALYIDELKDLYNAEKQLLKALPKMARNATDPKLQKAFSDHLVQTEGQVDRLEQIFESLEESPRGKKCKGMEGLIEEAKELLEEDTEEEVLDAGLISKAQHVEHYEIAGYGTVRTYALTLGETDHAELLQETLEEEKEADRLLTSLAEGSINIEAAIGGEESEADSTGSRGEREVTRSVASEKRGGTNRKRGSRRNVSSRTEAGSR